jgi:hypothetical protein
VARPHRTPRGPLRIEFAINVRPFARFRENIDLLLSQVEGRVIALMCTEFDISKCHRRFIVVEIIKKGNDVTVIDKEGNAGKHILNFSPKRSKRRKTVVDSKNQSKLIGF